MRIPEASENSSVTEIGSQSFFGSSMLVAITIPSSVTKIGNEAFGRCFALKEASVFLMKKIEVDFFPSQTIINRK